MSCPVDHSEYRKGRTDGPTKCTWFPNTTEKSPHKHYVAPRNKIMNTILENVGRTPLVRLNRIPQEEGVECEVLVKCEFFNAGGSVKDRIGKRMVEDAEAAGRIKPGDTLIEPTSGNTGIGLALAAAIKGYRMIITMPEKMSQEKVDILKALGAEIIRTPTEAAFDAPDSHISVAERLNKEIPNSHILDQYVNPSNPMAHYDETAEEILDACDGRVDYFVAGAGTGGTISGTARKLKERCPDITVVGVDPKGSILAEPAELNVDAEGYQVEGIGYDFIPTVLDRSIIDQWVKSSDKPSFDMARRLIRSEGLLCGGSSGTALAAALQFAKENKLGADKRMVVILPDSIRNYMSKHLSDAWMWRHGFMEIPSAPAAAGAASAEGEWWHGRTVGSLKLATPFTVDTTISCGEAVHILDGQGFDQLPVVDASGDILGVVTEGNLTARLTSGRVKGTDPVTKALYRQFCKVNLDTPLRDLAHVFDRDHFALVVSSQKCFSAGKESEKTVVTGVVTRIDLLKFISAGSDTAAAKK